MFRYLPLSKLRYFVVTNRDRFLFEEERLRGSKGNDIKNHPQHLEWLHSDHNNFSNNYSSCRELLSYYPLRYKCKKRIKELLHILENNSHLLVNWVKENEVFYTEEVFTFELLFFDWIDFKSSNYIKINKYIYTDREPFEQVYFFVKIFGVLLWELKINTLPGGSLISPHAEKTISETVAKYFQ